MINFCRRTDDEADHLRAADEQADQLLANGPTRSLITIGPVRRINFWRTGRRSIFGQTGLWAHHLLPTGRISFGPTGRRRI